MPHDLDTFKNSLLKLSVASYQYRAEQNVKKLKEISQAIGLIKAGQKLPNQLKLYDNRSLIELGKLERETQALSSKWKKMTGDAMMDECLSEHLEY